MNAVFASSFALGRGVAIRAFRLEFICFCILLASGCTTIPYEYTSERDFVNGPPLAQDEEQFVVGKECSLLDASDWIWPGSLLRKLLLWNSRVDSHQVSDKTVDALRKYLGLNHLARVKVRINAYCVGDEWSRTMRNDSIAPAWRYTMGFWSWLIYTILPGRFFGGDSYNPYSNTINIYSDIPSIALHEGGHAKDFAKRKYKGTYAFFYSFVPFYNLYPEALATNDALSYLYAQEDWDEYRQAYKLLYPAYGTYVGGDLASWIAAPWTYWSYLGYAAVLPGHALGRIKAAQVGNIQDDDQTANDGAVE